MNRRVLFGVAGWLAVAGAATAAGVAAIDVLEDGITGRSVRPLDEEAVHRALGRTTPVARPDPSPSASALRSLGTGGGTVTARCSAGKVTIVAVIPAQGFHTDRVERGPASSLVLRLESDDEEYSATVTCENGSPVVHEAVDDGHRRGRHGRG